MTVRTATIPASLAIQAAKVLEREAHQLHDSYTVPGAESQWEDEAAKRDHDHYRSLASQLRRAAKP